MPKPDTTAAAPAPLWPYPVLNDPRTAGFCEGWAAGWQAAIAAMRSAQNV
jgi:hypothetical protein